MDEDKKTVDLEDEKQEEETTVEETDAENVDDAKVEETEDDATEPDDDPYEKELRRLDDERKKAETIATQKSGALKEEREKRKKLEERLEKLERQGSDAKSIVEQVRAELRQDKEIEALSSNPKEQQLIREYVKTKNLTPDEAYILANRHVVIEQKRREAETDQEELALARLSGRSISGQSKTASALERMAAEGLTEAERKHLSI